LHVHNIYIIYLCLLGHLICRYVSAPEAMWRLSEYRMHEQSHTIYRLSIHLPEQQRVYFRAGEEAEAVKRESSRKAHLTAWLHRGPKCKRVPVYRNPTSLCLHWAL